MEKEEDSRRLRGERLSNAAMIVFAGLGLAAAVGSVLWAVSSSSPTTVGSATVLLSDVLRQVGSIANSMEERTSALEERVDVLSQIPDEAKVASKLSEIERRSQELDIRMESLEVAILQDPSKALAIPLLRKEIDHLQETQEADVQAMREEIARIYDLSKWFVGLMFTMALSVAGLAINSFIGGRRIRESDSEGKALQS